MNIHAPLCSEQWYTDILRRMNPDQPEWAQIQQTLSNPVGKELLKKYVEEHWELILNRLGFLQVPLAADLLEELKKSYPELPILLETVQKIQTVDHFMETMTFVFSPTSNPIQLGCFQLRQLLEKPELCFFFFYRHVAQLPIRKRNILIWMHTLPKSIGFFESFMLYRLRLDSTRIPPFPPMLKSIFEKWAILYVCNHYHIPLQPFTGDLPYQRMTEDLFSRKWKKMMLHMLQSVHHSNSTKPVPPAAIMSNMEEPRKEEEGGQSMMFNIFGGSKRRLLGKKKKGGNGSASNNNHVQAHPSKNSELYHQLTKPISQPESSQPYVLINVQSIPKPDEWFGWITKEDKNHWTADEWNLECIQRHIQWFKKMPVETLESLIYLLQHQTFKNVQDVLFFYFTTGWPIEYAFPFFLYVMQSQQSWNRSFGSYPTPSNTEQYIWYMASCLFLLHKYVGSNSFLKHIHAFYCPKSEKLSIESYLNAIIAIGSKSASGSNK
jgi:hypothetical protein